MELRYPRRTLAWRVTVILAQDSKEVRRTSFDDLLTQLKGGGSQSVQIVTPKYCGTNAITGVATLSTFDGTVRVTCAGQLSGKTVRIYTIRNGLVFGKFVN